jgi:hypothetical protein
LILPMIRLLLPCLLPPINSSLQLGILLMNKRSSLTINILSLTIRSFLVKERRKQLLSQKS